MRSWRLAAAKSCWWIFWKASAPPRWCNARARARRERQGRTVVREPGAAGLARSGHVGEDGGYCRRLYRARATVVDVAGRHLRDCMGDHGCAGARPQALPRIAEAPDLHAASCAFRAGCYRYPVVGCGLGRAALCDRPDREAADVAAAVLPFRALDARHVGADSFSGVLHAADGDVLDRGSRSEHYAEERRRRTRHFRQELYRPEPGIRVVRRGARLPGHHVLAGETNLAGGIADRGIPEL